MQWFKHDADAATDAKIKKMLIRYGPIGYAVYFHCLELITSDISESNINFELEHDSEIIADNLKVKGTADRSGIDIVEEVMRYMVEVGLFENQGGRIFCFKLLKRLDTSMTGNQKMRSLISNAKTKNRDMITDDRQDHDAVMTPSCKKRTDEIRREEKSKATRADTYHNGVPVNQATLDAIIDEYGQTVVDDYIERITDYCAAQGKQYKDYSSACRNWLKRDKVKPQTIKEYKGTAEQDALINRIYGNG